MVQRWVLRDPEQRFQVRAFLRSGWHLETFTQLTSSAGLQDAVTRWSAWGVGKSVLPWVLGQKLGFSNLTVLHNGNKSLYL